MAKDAPTLAQVEPERQPTEPDKETVPPEAAEDQPPAEEDQPPVEEPAAEERPPAARQRWKVPFAVGIGAGVVGLSLLVGLVTWNISRAHHPHPAQASGSRPAAATHPVPDADGCRWWAANPATKQYQRNVGIPPHSRTHRTGTRTMSISTNHGPILVKLDAGRTPCTVASFTFLAGRHFFDETGCHRLVTDEIYLLQCGDPSGTGRGGPSYAFADELAGTRPLLRPSGTPGLVVYPRGTVALANSGKDANGSQFFIVYKDSPIPPAFTPFGTVMAGMGVVDEAAAAGDDGAYAPDPGGGHPRLPITISTLSVS